MAVQWLRLHAANAGDTGLIPGQATKIPRALWPKRKKKKDLFSILTEYPLISNY